jgi:hypothetical protein
VHAAGPPHTGSPPGGGGAAHVQPWQARDLEDRVVAVTGLGREGRGPRAFVMLALVAVIAGAAMWVISRF